MKTATTLLIALLSLLIASSCSPAHQEDPVEKVLAEQDVRERAAKAEVDTLHDKCVADSAAYSAVEKNLLHFKSCSDYFRSLRAGLEDTVANRQCTDDVWQAQTSCRDYDQAVKDFHTMNEEDIKIDDSMLIRPSP